jgi:hypothetical protein
MTVKNVYFFLGVLLIPLLFGLLPIDMINGLILRESSGDSLSLGQIYKLPILIVMLFAMLIKPRLFLVIISLFSILFVSTLLRLSFNFEIYIKDIISILKWLTPLISFYFFSELFKLNLLSRSLRNWIYFSYLVMAVNILISLFGFGFPMYSNAMGAKIGTRGFFYAGNEVSVTLLVLYSFVAYQIIKSKFSFPFFLLNVFLAILVSSKTVILGIILVYLLIRNIGKQSKTINSRIIIKRTVLTILIIISLFYLFSAILSTPFGDRLIFFYNKLDFLTFILSGRNLFFLNNYDLLRANYNFLFVLFGVGYSEYSAVFKKMVEIDVLDLFFTFGLVGVTIFIFSIARLLYTTYESRFNSEKYRFSYYLTLVLILSSSMTGHTFNSGMAGIFIGFCLAYYNLKGENEAK